MIRADQTSALAWGGELMMPFDAAHTRGLHPSARTLTAHEQRMRFVPWLLGGCTNFSGRRLLKSIELALLLVGVAVESQAQGSACYLHDQMPRAIASFFVSKENACADRLRI